ncbi:MAG: spore coat associated protein CotJA [Clostridia bacterium]|nr:spore coat associated protein CotJA [Clostridia bacterium]
MTPRERINDALLRRVLDSNSSSQCCCGSESNNGSNERSTWGLEEFPLASMYAPLQSWRNIYDTESGFGRGTIFKELDLPFVCGDRRGGGCSGK